MNNTTWDVPGYLAQPPAVSPETACLPQELRCDCQACVDIFITHWNVSYGIQCLGVGNWAFLCLRPSQWNFTADIGHHKIRHDLRSAHCLNTCILLQMLFRNLYSSTEQDLVGCHTSHHWGCKVGVLHCWWTFPFSAMWCHSANERNMESTFYPMRYITFRSHRLAWP